MENGVSESIRSTSSALIENTSYEDRTSELKITVVDYL